MRHAEPSVTPMRRFPALVFALASLTAVSSAAPAADLTSVAIFAEDAPSQTVQVQSGDTLMSLLTQQGLAANVAQDAIDALTSVWSPRALKIGQEIAIEKTAEGLQELRFAANLDREIIVSRRSDGHFTAETRQRHLAHVRTLAAGVIHTSLFDAATAAGVPMPVLDAMVQGFSYDIDFQRDLQPDDSFEVLFDRLYDANGKPVGTGDVLYAAMTLGGKTLRIYRYLAPGSDTADYYNLRGESVKKALLRTPVNGARLTSGFGMRQHPILGYSKMHRGVDFGAPTGTPIMAAGDATVEQAGYHGGYGNFILLHHSGTFETAYAHMSRIAPGIRPGRHVHQGEVIGYVGATGMATGPHLHYEVRIKGSQVNPTSIKMQPGRQLLGHELVEFRAAAGSIDGKLFAMRRDAIVASLPGWPQQ